MTSASAHREVPVICSPVATLRLLALAEDARITTIDEPEQLVLPLEWARLVPAAAAITPVSRDRIPPRIWGERIVLACFEIMLGRRSAGQLARLVDARTLQVLTLQMKRYSVERNRGNALGRPRPKVTSIRCYQPHADAAEITAVVHDGYRHRAVAVRLSARDNQWVTTAFETA